MNRCHANDTDIWEEENTQTVPKLFIFAGATEHSSSLPDSFVMDFNPLSLTEISNIYLLFINKFANDTLFTVDIYPPRHFTKM